jgi:hypothetical protein
MPSCYPLARRYTAPHGVFTALLMSTGLTFGTISSLYGPNAGVIDETQFSLLITVVVLSAIVPTAIAQRFFQPVTAVEITGMRPGSRWPSTGRASGSAARVEFMQPGQGSREDEMIGGE